MITKKNIIIFVAGAIIGAELFHALSHIATSLSSGHPIDYVSLGISAAVAAFLLWCAYKFSWFK